MSFSSCFGRLIYMAVLAQAIGASAEPGGLPEIPASDATNYLDQQVVVTDRVVQVVIRPTIWLLHLSQNYPKSPLNCVVRGSYTNNFPNFEDYLGQRVEVTGRITEHAGRLEMVLTTTSQIKIVTATIINLKPAPPVAEAPVKAAEPGASAPALASATRTIAKTDDSSGRILGWMLGLLAVIVALLVFGFILFWRGKSADVRAIRSVSALAKSPDDTPADGSSDQEWKQRALVAEAMAGKQGQLLREKILPELTEFAKQSLVQGLYAQRNVLMERQQKAQQSLAELEMRLTVLQLPLQQRICAYEKRIAELEREVETQGEEMRELTRATLALVRKKLEDERELERAGPGFN